MTTKSIKIFLTIVNFFLLTFISHGQIIGKNDSKVKKDQDLQQKTSKIKNNLIGEWGSSETICYTKGDTIIQESIFPITVIILDSSQNFKISQRDIKCPQINNCPLKESKGQYVISLKKKKNIVLFYITFNEKVLKNVSKNKNDLASSFNGYVIDVKNNTFQLNNGKNCLYVFNRQ